MLCQKRSQKKTPQLGHQMWIKFKNIIGGVAVIYGIAVFSYVYYTLKMMKINDCSVDEVKLMQQYFNNLFWITICFVFSVFSGLLFAENRNKGVGSLYLMGFGFFGICFSASLFDYITLDVLRMSKVYWALIGSAALTSITYFYKWIKHYLS